MGYIGRIISSYETPNWNLVPYTWQALLLLLAPAFFSASIYMTLGRIILMVDGEGLALLSRRYLTKVFVTGDIVFLVLQAIGMFLHTPPFSPTQLSHTPYTTLERTAQGKESTEPS